MKLLPLIGLIGLSGTVIAQTATTSADRRAVLSDRDVTILWEKLTILTSGETDEDIASHLRSHGIGEDGAKSLKALHARGRGELQQIGEQFYAKLCSRQKEIRESGGSEMVAQMVEETIRQETEARRRALGEVDQVLSLHDQERLDHLYSSDHGPKVGITETNIANRVRSGEISVESAIATACNKSHGKEK